MKLVSLELWQFSIRISKILEAKQKNQFLYHSFFVSKHNLRQNKLSLIKHSKETSARY